MLSVLAMSAGRTSPRRRWARDAVVALAQMLGMVVLCGVIGAQVGCGNIDERPQTWAFVSTAIMEPSCATANCHSALAARAEVDLSTRQAGYASLVTRNFVVPDTVDPPIDAELRVERSTILRLMRAEGTLRMPPDAPLPEIDIHLIERWIRDGAKNN